MPTRLLLACDGGPAVLAAIARLAAADDSEVVTLTLDFGRGEALEAVRDRALAAGASRAHVLEVRDEFARDYLVPALRAGALALAGGRAALRGALTARKLAEIAALEGATPVEARSVADAGPGERTSPPDAPAQVEIAFAGGAPAALNGVAMPPAELFGTLATIAGGDAPADLVLHGSHAALVAALLPADLVELSGALAARYAALVAEGRWSTPARAALDAFFAAAQADASGAVWMKLVRGECAAVGVSREGLP